MSMTYSVLSRTPVAGKQLLVVNATFDDSYPTGGEPVIPSELSLYAVDVCVPLNTNSATKAVQWDQTNRKLKVLTSALASGTVTAGVVVALGNQTAEVANASDQSALVSTLLLIGF